MGSLLQHVGSFSCGHADSLVAACMWDLVLQPGIEPGPHALGAWSLTHWTMREVPFLYSFNTVSLLGKYELKWIIFKLVKQNYKKSQHTITNQNLVQGLVEFSLDFWYSILLFSVSCL